MTHLSGVTLKGVVHGSFPSAPLKREGGGPPRDRERAREHLQGGRGVPSVCEAYLDGVVQAARPAACSEDGRAKLYGLEGAP